MGDCQILYFHHAQHTYSCSKDTAAVAINVATALAPLAWESALKHCCYCCHFTLTCRDAFSMLDLTPTVMKLKSLPMWKALGVAITFGMFLFIAGQLSFSGRLMPERLSTAALKPSASCSYFMNASKFDDACDPRSAVHHAALAAAAGGCQPSGAPEELLFHMYSTHLGNWVQLMVKAWALTQDLRRSKLIIWLPSAEVDKHTGNSMLTSLDPHVSLKAFDYQKEIAGTPLELSAHFNNQTKILEGMDDMRLTSFSDIIRLVLLHNYGGVWLDSDAVPLRDLWNITAGVGLSFLPKFVNDFSNNHFIYINRPRSALARRRLQIMVAYPYNFEAAWPRKFLHPTKGWLYNVGLTEHVLLDQAILYSLPSDGHSIPDATALPDGAWDNVELAYPLGWFDPWWGCEKNLLTFKDAVPCRNFFVFHRLNKGHAPDVETKFGITEFRQEIETLWNASMTNPRVVLGAFARC